MKSLLIPLLSILILSQVAGADSSPEATKIRRSFVAVKFLRINGEGRIEQEFTNLTGKDIRDLRGSVIYLDADGEEVYGVGFTFAIDSIFIKRGETKKNTGYLSVTDEVGQGKFKGKSAADVMKANASTIKAYFEASEIVYGDGTKEERLEKIK